MKREAINKLQRIIDTHRKDEFITCEETCWCWDVEGIIHSLELSLPPAEGAEEMLKKYTIYCKNVISAEGKVWVLSTVIPQVMNEFAALHAQKIADQLAALIVENDRLKKLLQSQNPFPNRPNPRDVNPYDSKAIKRWRNSG